MRKKSPGILKKFCSSGVAASVGTVCCTLGGRLIGAGLGMREVSADMGALLKSVQGRASLLGEKSARWLFLVESMLLFLRWC